MSSVSTRIQTRSLTLSQIERTQTNSEWDECDGYVFGNTAHSEATVTSGTPVESPQRSPKACRQSKRNTGCSQRQGSQSTQSSASPASSSNRAKRQPKRVVRYDDNFRSTNSRGQPRRSRSQHSQSTASSSDSSVDELDDDQRVQQPEDGEEADMFQQCAEIAGNTLLLDLPVEKLGVLTLLPNSVSELSPKLIPILRSVYTKLLTDVLHPRIHPDGELEAFKKFILAPVVLFTAQKSGALLDECTTKCNLMLKDDWSQFTLANLIRVKSARTREGAATAEAKQRHVERAIQRYLNIGNL